MDPIEELTRKIAAQETSTRRKFFAALGKIAGSAAAVVAGISVANTGTANASTTCCDVATPCSGTCPSGTSNKYTWSCCAGCGTVYTLCHDCYNNNNGAYACTWHSGGGGRCPC